MGNNVKWFQKCRKTIWLISICCFVFSARAEAAYSPDGAVNYAKSHCASGHTSGSSNCPNSWQCAEFVSKCLQKGGMGNATKAGCRSLYTELKKYGTSYALTVDSKGYINVKSNQGKISVGDVIITHCNTHDLYLHAVLVSSIDSNGYVYNYAHNNNKMNQKLVASKWCSKQGGNEAYSKITAYVIHFPQSANATHTTCTWDSGKVTKKATCTSSGTRTYTCTVCKKTKTSVIAATGHKGGTATCTSQAKCSTCGASYGSYGSHQYSTDWTIDKAASCATAGSKSHHCKYCATKKDVTSIPATGHKGGTATCTSQAKCSTCGSSYGDYGNHQYNTDWTIDKAASCTTAGSKSHHCKYCDAQKDVTSIPATGHSWDEGTVLRQATETTTGLKSYTCYNCGATKTETLPIIENEELEEGDMLTDPKSDADYEIIELQNGMGTVKYLGSNANAKTIKIPETITVYGVTYKVTSIGEGAFEGDRNVTRIIMGNNITNIERNAFKGCSKLTGVVIGNNVTQIGDKAFYKCKKLTKITIPSKVTKIGKQAFYGCKRLKSITIKTTKLTSKTIGSKAFKGTYERAMVKVPKSKLKIYQKILKEKGIGAKAKIGK